MANRRLLLTLWVLVAPLAQAWHLREVQAQKLSGFADMHTHPMSHVGFGGKIVYGAPDLGATMLAGQKHRGAGCNGTNEVAGSLAEALGDDNAMHGGPGLFDNTCGDVIRSAIIDQIEESYIYEFPNLGLGGQINDHPHGGYPNFAYWPHWSTVTHQQMYWEWIRRAHEYGLNVMVALAVTNNLLAKAAGGNQWMDDKSSIEFQLLQMRDLVARHADFMEIAYTASDLRRIASGGRLAVVLGVETDDFGNLTRRAAFSGETITLDKVTQELLALRDLGVRYLLPIHFSNTVLGGYALDKDLFALNSKNISNGFPVPRVTCTEGIHFRLDRTDFGGFKADLLRSRDLGWIIDTQPDYGAPGPGCGHANSLPLTSLGTAALGAMMDLGFMIDIDHMSRLAANASLDIAKVRDYPLNSGHNGPVQADCPGSPSDPDHCNENNRTFSQYQQIAQSGGMIGLGTAGTATAFSQNYGAILELAGNRPVAIGTDMNGLAPLPRPDPASPVAYGGLFPRYTFGSRTWDLNVDGLAHYGMLPDYVFSWRITSRARDAFMSSAEGFARMWEKTERRAATPPRYADLMMSSAWCTHAGATTLLGDFNGDRQTDLLCRDPARAWIGDTDNSGVPLAGPSTFHETAWCTHSGAALFLGDFDGDGRTDLLCHDSSRLWVELAAGSGVFSGGTDWTTATAWCPDAASQLHVGDFNGDGRTDLLCKQPDRLQIMFSDGQGRFDGFSDIVRSTSWCSHAGATLLIGDFNGDGRDDLMCRDTSQIWIDYADPSRVLEGVTDWNIATSWCTTAGATLHVGDVDGDNQDDLICTAPGRLAVSYADFNGRFAPVVNRFLATSWCAATGDKLFVGDFNGDARVDLMCKGSTAIKVDYVSLSSLFSR